MVSEDNIWIWEFTTDDKSSHGLNLGRWANMAKFRITVDIGTTLVTNRPNPFLHLEVEQRVHPRFVDISIPLTDWRHITFISGRSNHVSYCYVEIICFTWSFYRNYIWSQKHIKVHVNMSVCKMFMNDVAGNCTLKKN